MNLDMLISCTIIFLELLIELYNAKKISCDVFNNANPQLKIRFLQDNLKNIKSIEEKAKAEKLIAKYYKILSGIKVIS